MNREQRDAAICAAYGGGQVVRQISTAFDLDPTRVYAILKASGVKPNRSKANRWREQGQA